MTKSRGDDVFLTDDQYWCLSMAITGRLPMALKGSAGGRRLARSGVLVGYKGIVLRFP